MEADFSIELRPEDEVLEFPWSDPDGRLQYYDLKRNPECIDQIAEAQQFLELRHALAVLNSPRSRFETAKCDAWPATELTVEDEIFGAKHKYGCYVDLLFCDQHRFSFEAHDRFARELVRFLKRTPSDQVRIEVLLRRCYHAGEIHSGFYFTLYVFGYGNDEWQAKSQCGSGLQTLLSAISTL